MTDKRGRTQDRLAAVEPASEQQGGDVTPRELDSYRLLMIEQPLAQDDLRRHARLQDRLETPIRLDGSIPQAAVAEDMLALGAGGSVNIKPGRVGGFAQALAVHDECQHHAVPIWCGRMLESGIGRACNVALAALPNFTLPGDVSPSTRYWTAEVVTPEWTMDSTRDGDGTRPIARASASRSTWIGSTT